MQNHKKCFCCIMNENIIVRIECLLTAVMADGDGEVAEQSARSADSAAVQLYILLVLVTATLPISPPIIILAHLVIPAY